MKKWDMFRCSKSRVPLDRATSFSTFIITGHRWLKQSLRTKVYGLPRHPLLKGEAMNILCYLWISGSSSTWLYCPIDRGWNNANIVGLRKKSLASALAINSIDRGDLRSALVDTQNEQWMAVPQACSRESCTILTAQTNPVTFHRFSLPQSLPVSSCKPTEVYAVLIRVTTLCFNVISITFAGMLRLIYVDQHFTNEDMRWDIV